MRNLLRGFIFLCGALPVAVYGQAVTPSQDAYYVPANATNFGGATSITVGSSGSIGLVQFDLTTLPAGATVQKATLTLFINKVNVPGGISVNLANGSWQESTVS